MSKKSSHMNDELSHFSKHRVSVIPNSIKTQHFTVHLQELADFVILGDCLADLRSFRLCPLHNVGVLRDFWLWKWRVQLNALTLQEILQMLKNKLYIVIRWIACSSVIQGGGGNREPNHKENIYHSQRQKVGPISAVQIQFMNNILLN